MVRIGGSTDRGEHIKEQDYYTPSGEFRVDSEGSQVKDTCKCRNNIINIFLYDVVMIFYIFEIINDEKLHTYFYSFNVF